MITANQINYVAGILEGEGTFLIVNSSISIVLNMTDEDVVRKVRNIMNRDVLIKRYKTKHKDNYRFNICGALAVQWMMTIYSLMGVRRRSKIKELLSVWKLRTRKQEFTLRSFA